MTDKPDLYTAMAEALNAPRDAVKLAAHMGTYEANPDLNTLELEDRLKAGGQHHNANTLRRLVNEWMWSNLDKIPAPNADQRREAAISFAYGNAAIDNPNVTRAMVRDAWNKMQPVKYYQK